jgi:hypothetical protein
MAYLNLGEYGVKSLLLIFPDSADRMPNYNHFKVESTNLLKSTAFPLSLDCHNGDISPIYATSVFVIFPLKLVLGCRGLLEESLPDIFLQVPT